MTSTTRLCKLQQATPHNSKDKRARLKHLKVHKRENFLGFDFEICTFSLIVMPKCSGFALKKILLDHYWGR